MSLIKNYIPALFTALVWGSTFVASKHVLDAGISVVTLMTLRFGLAYVLTLMVSRERCRIEWNVTELKLLVAGLCGGSLYFLMEYMALKRTSAINVALISSTVPIISASMEMLIKRRRPRWKFVVGTFVAIVGVLLLVTDGKLLIDIFPIGDILAIGSSVLWALYSVVIGRVGKCVSEVVVERRMMFYSFVTILPVTFCVADVSELRMAMSSVGVWMPMLYLGGVASAGCMWLWNVSINRIGVVRTNNFLYLLPVVSLCASALVMDGEVTSVSAVATVMIFVGVVVADRN